MYKKSEMGGKSAWKGFSTQTLYIANRLINEEKGYKYFPEKKEDLCIKDGEKIIELVQVKNYNHKLTLSDLDPQLKSGFISRSIFEIQNDKDIEIKIVSFGEIGNELKNRNNSTKSKIVEKLKKYKYTLEEIDFFLDRLDIVKVNEEELKCDILYKFEKNDELKIMKHMLYEKLIYYIAYLSRFNGFTTKEEWDNEVNNIIADIQQMKVFQDEYKKTIMQMSDDRFYSNFDFKQLEKEYRLGIDSRPEHIRRNLDIYREKWIKKIYNKFLTNNLLIIKGSSGQGKSTLAYRYLLDNYTEGNIFIVENIKDRQHAINLSKGINGLHKNSTEEIIFYLDVKPYQKDWIWLVEEINKIDNDIKLLITIRYDDYNRTSVNIAKDRFEEIILDFSKKEAQEVYINSNNKKFLNFEESWKEFGEEGPFLEYIYLLNESQTIESRIKEQINLLIDEIDFKDDWLEVLAVIMNLGRYNLSTNINQLKKVIRSDNMTKLFKNLEKEHFIKNLNQNSVIGLHSIRSNIILKVLKDYIYIEDEDLLINSIESCDEDFYMLIIEFFYNNKDGDGKHIISRMLEIDKNNWNCYFNILNATLWLDSYKYYLEAKNDLDSIGINNLPLFFGDMTGLLDIILTNDITNLFKSAPNNFKKTLQKYSNKKMDFTNSKFYLEKILKDIEQKEIINIANLSMISFILLFMEFFDIKTNNLNIKIDDEINNSNLDYWLDFIYVLKVQEIGYYKNIEKSIVQEVGKKYGFISIENLEKQINAEFIYNYFLHDNINMNLELMDRVSVLYRLYPNKSIYNVKEISGELLGLNEINEKNIKKENMPMPIISRMNSWIRHLDLYNKRPETWKEYFEELESIKIFLLNIVEDLLIGIEYLYKTGGNFSKLVDTSKISRKWNSYERKVRELEKNNLLEPKITKDKFGFIEEDKKEYSMIKNEDLFTEGLENKNNISYLCSNYTRSFKNFMFQKNELLLKLLKKDCNHNILHINMINLIDSLERLDKFNNEIINIYEDYVSLDLEEEFNSLLLLSVYWVQLINSSRIYKNNSLKYDTKELIKNNRSKMKRIFISMKSVIEEVDITIINTTANIITDEDNLEEIIDYIYKEIRNEFISNDWQIYNYVFFIGYLDKLNLIIINKDFAYTSEYEFSIKDIFIYDNFDLFKNSITHGLNKSLKLGALNKNQIKERFNQNILEVIKIGQYTEYVGNILSNIDFLSIKYSYIIIDIIEKLEIKINDCLDSALVLNKDIALLEGQLELKEKNLDIINQLREIKKDIGELDF